MPITSTGIGSGLDVNSIITQLVALEKRPLNQLQTSATFIQTQISTYGKVQSLVSNVNTAAAALAKSALWSQTWAGTDQLTAVTATASAGAAAGTYSVKVNQLAAAHNLASGAYTDATTQMGAGKLKIEFGGWTPDSNDPDAAYTFAPNAGSTALNLTFSDSATTLEDVRKAINDAKAGVTASIVRDASGARLTVRSDKTGEENALRISATDLADAPLVGGLNDLRYTPDVDLGPNRPGLAQTVAAANAKAAVNGLDLVSSSNTFDGAIENVKLTVSALNTTPATITVSNDDGAQKKAIQDFATAYNAFNAFLVDQTKYDPSNKIGGTLQGDSTALNLRNQLRGMLADKGSGSVSFFSLTSSAGTAPRDGTITLDTDKLTAALKDPTSLGKLFAGDGVTTGMAKKLADFTAAVTGVTGTLSSRAQALTDSLKRNQTEQDRVQTRIDGVTLRLQKQYQALDARMGQLNALSAYVTQQFSYKNNSNNN